eukprot:5740512-Prymnesium_polylepis.1
MCAALGYEVTRLHRERVMGIDLRGLRRGQWAPLSADEMCVVDAALSEGDVPPTAGPPARGRA